jgi:hypothetical protein
MLHPLASSFFNGYPFSKETQWGGAGCSGAVPEMWPNGSANKLLSEALERDREWLDERRDIAESFYKLSANDHHADTFLSLVERSERIMDKFKSGRSQTRADTFSVTSVCMSSPRIWEPAPAASGEEFALDGEVAVALDRRAHADDSVQRMAASQLISEESDPKPTEEKMSDQVERSCQPFADEQGDGQILEHAGRLEERRRKMEERKRKSWKNLVISDENSDSLFLTINLHDALDRRADFFLEEPIPPSPGSTKKLGQIQSTVPPNATLPQQQDHTAIPLIVPRLRGDWEELSEGEEECEKDGGPGMETENRKSLFPDLDVPTEGSVPPPSLVHEGKKCKQREMLATAQTEQQRDGENTTQFARSGDDAAATTNATQDRIGAAAERKEERRRKLEQRKRRSWKHLLMEDQNCDSLFLEINLHDALDTHTDSTTEAQLELHRD